ncbi:dephospho-CoA kinase [Nesterenkonia alba]|uniref:dephospho-CoA kinase n=1 Tax=Nesterenkonia alba TaxID=515814 RepID=UPI000A04B3E0|nr:dephospho-CoA kinase [Nesterenkonia alba]
MGRILSVGLTGGIGSGKSAVAQRLAEHGAIIIDADVLAREVVAPGTEGLAEVVETFGEKVLTAQGTLDRQALGRIVFDDDAARSRLNDIIHPRVRQESRARREAAPEGSVVVEDIPLLVETGQAERFDVVVVVQAPYAERIRRLTESRGMSREEAEARIAAQATDAERAAVADVVLDNSGTLEDLHHQVDEFFTTLER